MSGTEILLTIAGAVALLLWGVRMVRTGMTRAFGSSLHRAVATGTANRLRAFGIGLGVTALLQSSTATALIVSSFAGRGLLATAAALPVLLGADVGTAVVAQVLSLDLSLLAPVLILGGVVSFMSASGGRRRHLGRVAIGIGLMLMALGVLRAASAPLNASPALMPVIAGLADEPWLAILIAALFTWLAHSSLAIVLLVAALVGTGAVPLPLAFALVLGANAGGGVPAVAMTHGADPAARRPLVGNLLMRIVGVVAVALLLDNAGDLLSRLDAAPARQVVYFHIAFNLFLAAVFVPLTGPVARLSRLLLPPPRGDDAAPDVPRHLDRNALDTPPVALAGAARETLRMGEIVETMLRRSMEAIESDPDAAAEISGLDEHVDRLYEAIKLYLIELSRAALDAAESRRYVEVLTFTTNLEHVGDIIDISLMELAVKKARHRLSFTPQGLAEIRAFHGRVVANMQLAFNVFMSGDVDMARRLLAEKSAIREAEFETSGSHFERLRKGQSDAIETSGLHLDIIRDLKRINAHLTSVAYPILEKAGELEASRLKGGGRRPAAASRAKAAD
ncbi:MAG: Na/Pi cotransporter family protein [Alphaproteobacteria bacterium]